MQVLTTEHFERLLEQIRGDLDLMSAVYNCGITSVFHMKHQTIPVFVYFCADVLIGLKI